MRTQWKFLTLRTISNALILSGVVFLGLSIWPVLSSELLYRYRELRGVEYTLGREEGGGKREESPFGRLIHQPTPIRVEPVSREFGIVIEKIGVNAPVVADVDVTSATSYKEAMRHGVAHARGTVKPGEVGNCYLFAHSSLNFWALGEYATVFNLLRKLEVGDRVVLFYKDQMFDYRVVSKEIVSGFNTEPLLRTFNEPMLTLQTCHPPGTTFNRLIITTQLKTP